MKKRLLFLAFIAPGLLVASAGGAVHPLGDSLAVFRAYIAMAAFLSGGFLLLFGWPRTALVVGVLSIGAGGAIWWSYVNEQASGPFDYSLYQKNMLYLPNDRKPLIADIKKKSPDFATFQEFTSHSESVLDALKDTYPTQARCISQRNRGVALASRFASIPNTTTCRADLGFLSVQLETPDGPVWLVSLHLRWPFPVDQAAQVGQIVPILNALKGPVVLAGDFNMVPWSYTMTRIEKAARSQRVGKTNGTFLFEKKVMLPIDHVLAPTGCPGRVSTLDLLGSDHHGVLARFSLKPCL